MACGGCARRRKVLRGPLQTGSLGLGSKFIKKIIVLLVQNATNVIGVCSYNARKINKLSNL